MKPKFRMLHLSNLEEQFQRAMALMHNTEYLDLYQKRVLHNIPIGFKIFSFYFFVSIIKTRFFNSFICQIILHDPYRKKFIKLLKFTLTNYIVCFNTKFYKQLQGAAMGSSVSPLIANIYMEYFESLAIPSSPTLIRWWFRYVDDVHSATRKDKSTNFKSI